jgi:hypothetical protein
MLKRLTLAGAVGAHLFLHVSLPFVDLILHGVLALALLANLKGAFNVSA